VGRARFRLVGLTDARSARPGSVGADDTGPLLGLNLSQLRKQPSAKALRLKKRHVSRARVARAGSGNIARLCLTFRGLRQDRGPCARELL
jgi:hypothetical protein